MVANAPPIADAGADRLVGVNQEVLFDGSRARDPDGAITSWLWDFGDGDSASGMNVRHRFRASGEFPVTLTVTDDTALENNRASATVMVKVNAPPEPVIAAPAAACPAEVVAFDGGQSRDADGAIERYVWRFGDGAAPMAPRSHTYAAPGRYSVALLADDGRDLNNSRQQSILDLHVNRPPRPMAGPDRAVCPGEAVTFDGAASNDWDGALVRYMWDFGDGTTAEGAQVVHNFAQPGLYQVRLSVTDDSGASCATATDTAQVHVNTPPVAAAGPIARASSAAPMISCCSTPGRRPMPTANRSATVGSGRRRDPNRREGAARLLRARRVRRAPRRRRRHRPPLRPDLGRDQGRHAQP